MKHNPPPDSPPVAFRLAIPDNRGVGWGGRGGGGGLWEDRGTQCGKRIHVTTKRILLNQNPQTAFFFSFSFLQDNLLDSF